ncbi:D-lactate dehydrogenase [cytochrome], mitochondrial, partial [Lachnellula hyalina]
GKPLYYVRHFSAQPSGTSAKERLPGGSFNPTSFFVGFILSTALGLSVFFVSRSEPGLSGMRSTTPLKGHNTPQYNLSQSNLDGARKELQELLGPEGVTDHLGTRIAHSSTEWSKAPRGDYDRPSLVVYPSTTEETAAISKICHKRQIPMIAFSGGTSLEGTLAAENGEICLDFKKMNKILEVHRDDMDVVVQPGVGYEDLNQALSKLNLFFPPDPGPGAQIGGMIGQGCSGTNAYRYGTMKDWVLGLTVVLADGTIIKTRHRPRKSSAGYDLTRLFVGSEGTLGIVTEASLRVTLKPNNIRIAVASFPTLHQATNTTIQISGSGHQLEAMELLDDVTMHAINKAGYTNDAWAEESTIFFKFSGETPQAVQKQIDRVEKLAKVNNCGSFKRSKTDEEAAALWQARKTALWSLLAMKRDPGDDFLSADVAVPISRLADIIDETKKMVEKSGLVGSCLGHVGDGNFHTTVLYSPHEKSIARKIIRDTQMLGVDMHGTVTGEHGIGLENRDALVYELGEDAVDAMRRLKLALDPLGLLNPGKIMRLRPSKD